MMRRASATRRRADPARSVLAPARAPYERQTSSGPSSRSAHTFSHVRVSDDAPGRTALLRVAEAAPNAASQPTGGSPSNEGATELGGLCIRTPLPPGIVRFEGCSAQQLSRYWVLPEHGDQPIRPAAGISYDSDGVWSADHPPSNSWFKVPSHCDATLRCSGSGFSWTSCCNAVATLYGGSPRWVTDDHEALKNIPR